MNACSSSSVAAASRSTVNARPIAAATPVSSAAGRDSRARRPAITACLEQLTGVQLDRFFEPPSGHRPLELLDVQPQRRIRAPPQCARPYLDQAVRVRQRTPQVMQDLAQVRVRLALGRVGP